MPNLSTLVFDIETIPDWAAWPQSQPPDPAATEDAVLDSSHHKPPLKPALQPLPPLGSLPMAPCAD